jgi:hypothetical protein
MYYLKYIFLPLEKLICPPLMTTLFPGERLISQSIDGDVNLTTHRILYEHKSWGQSSQERINPEKGNRHGW